MSLSKRFKNDEIVESTLLRGLREKNGFSYRDVADMLGISEETYAYLETGQIKVTARMASKLENLYGIDRYIFFKDSRQIDDFFCSKLFVRAVKVENDKLRKEIGMEPRFNERSIIPT